MFLPHSESGAGVANLEYAPVRNRWAAFRSSARPSTARRPTPATWRSSSASGPPSGRRVAHAAARRQDPLRLRHDRTGRRFVGRHQHRGRIVRDGDDYVINGRKWWTSGAPDPRCEVLIVMGKTDPDNPSRHNQQSMILVPMDTPGVTRVRALSVFGYDHAPHGHGEVELQGCTRSVSNILLGEGRGFEIAQGRLGPGRIHHCMRLIGLAERALELMCSVR